MTFNNEFDYLIHLVRCCVANEKPCELPNGMSFENVFMLGKLHEIANIAYLSVIQLQNQPNDELLNEWKEFYYISVQRDEIQQKAHRTIISRFCENGIRSLEVQGTVIKKLYPSTDMRMMSDIDIIIDEENFDKAEEILKQMGFETNYATVGELNAKLKILFIEIHAQYFVAEENGGKKRYYDAMHGTFDLAKPLEQNEFIYRLDNTHLYLYSLLHLLKHYEYSGCGIRRFVDFYYLRQLDGVDYDYINSVLKKVDLDKKANDLMSLFELWFYDKQPSYDLTNVMRRVLTAGNHGTEEQYLDNLISEGKKTNKSFSKYNLIIGFLFPSKQNIYDAYPFCEKHHYTLIMCWLHRFFASIFSPVKGIKHALKRIKRLNSIKQLDED